MSAAETIFEVDPLICPKCNSDMRIIAFIEDYKVVKKILVSRHTCNVVVYLV